MVKNLSANAGDMGSWVQSLGQEDPLEKEMATHSSILIWEIPWTEEPGMLQIKNCYTPFEVLLNFQYFIFRSEISLIVSVM